MIEYLRGRALSIWLWPGAEASWKEAELQVPRTRAACPVQFRARMAQLAETRTLRSPDHMNHEGSSVYAIKASCGLRAYGWFDQCQQRPAFIISHVILKKQQKLDPFDVQRTLRALQTFRAQQQAQRR